MFTSKNFLISSILSAGMLLASCAATEVALENHNLSSRAKMSSTIFLDPVPQSQKTIYVTAKNTSEQNINWQGKLTSSLSAKGYKVVSNPSSAHYILQANILSVTKVDPKEAEKLLSGGFGGAITSGVTAVAANTAFGSVKNTAKAGFAGAVVGFAANSLVKDVNYAIVTDVQIQERSKTVVHQVTNSQLSNGTATSTTQISKGDQHMKTYRTRIISNVDKMNLKIETAIPALEDSLVNSITGIF